LSGIIALFVLRFAYIVVCETVSLIFSNVAEQPDRFISEMDTYDKEGRVIEEEK